MINTDLPTPESCISDAQDVVAIEISAVKTLQQRIGRPFSLACEFMLGCTGRVIVVGMGKSGHIGRKIKGQRDRAIRILGNLEDSVTSGKRAIGIGLYEYSVA